jgi:hypothetical protein
LRYLNIVSPNDNGCANCHIGHPYEITQTM